MNIKEVKIADIKIENRLWDIDENTVVALVESISAIGLKTPPTVRIGQNGEYILIAGHHRVEACNRLGMKSIDVIIDNVDENYALIHEIDENLTRRPVHYAERGYQLNQRKIAYNKIFGEQLSVQTSFNRYYEDVKAVVNGKKTTSYDYSLFEERDFDFEYIKDRVKTNHMEDLFAHYIDKDGFEITKEVSIKDVEVAKRILPMLKAIDENTEYIHTFESDASKRFNLSPATIKQDLNIGENINLHDIDTFKKYGIDKNLAVKIATDSNKEQYIELIKEVSDDENNKGINAFIKKAMSIATKDVKQETGEKDSDAIYERVSDIVKNTVNSNKENGVNPFNLDILKTMTQNKVDVNQTISSDQSQLYINEIANLYNVATSDVNVHETENKIVITIKRRR